MADCPYLNFEASHCRACSGFYCTAAGRKKKLSDPSMCKTEEEWIECPRYVVIQGERAVRVKTRTLKNTVKTTPKKYEAHMAAVKVRGWCPYLGPRPDGKCCGKWCYAINVYLKLPHKTCGPGWLKCGRYWSGFENKVKFYGDE